MFNILQEIFGVLSRNKLRTLATGFAVSSGLFLMIVLQGAGNGVIHTMEENMRDFSFDAIHVFGGRTTMPHEGIKEGRYIRMDERDVRMAKTSFPQRLSDAMPLLNQSGMTASHGGNHVLNTSLKGVHPAYSEVTAVRMLKGRFINEIDLKERRKVVVIGQGSVDDLFGKGQEAVGKYLNMNGIAFCVVGVYKTNEMSNSTEFYAPFSTVSTIFSKGNTIDQMTMTINDIKSEEEMEEFIDDYARATSYIHSFNPKDRYALWIWNQAEQSLTMKKTRYILSLSFWILGLLTLTSGVVGVSNILLISVKERIREFGIRRAIGARPWNIIGMVMAESLVLTTIFGYIGMLAGIGFCEYMDSAVGGQTMSTGMGEVRVFQDPTVDISTCIIATLIIIVAGVSAGYFPARKAVKIKPIDALRG